MLESLYSKAINKKEIITKKVEEYEIANFDVSKHWKEGEIAESKDDLTIAAGDGSKHEKKFLNFYFYAISAESLIFNKLLSKIESSDIDVIPHSEFASDRIRNYMGLFEVKNALKTIKTYDIDYYLYDGSLLGDLIRPFPLEKEIPQKIKKEILNLSEEYLIKDINNIENIDVGISSTKIANSDLKEKFKQLKEYEPVIFLEHIEKLLTLSNLLKYKKKIIAISKTSTSYDYFNSNIPDIAIFDKHSPKAGFSIPTIPKPVYENSEKLKREFAVEDSFFKKLTFTIFYLRLERNKNILKIELPYRADEKDIKKIIGVINKTSSEGYPYLLKKAHHDVIIKKRDIEQLFKIFGFYEKPGREML
ncbi:MAG: DNA double-strand break repair nuclease NurA [Methanobrevibacter sp.]|nr:DNA double-strand break repair nuclease NurA [Methanobrevibacter sp.]